MELRSGTTRACRELLHKLKEGQYELKRSLRDVEPQKNPVRRGHVHARGDPLCCVDRLPKRRARVDQLSPETTPILAGRCTKKKRKTNHHLPTPSSSSTTTSSSSSSSPPSQDLSLEDALLANGGSDKDAENSRKTETSKFEQRKKTTTRKINSAPLSKVVQYSASLLRRYERERDTLSRGKRKARGLTVSFMAPQNLSPESSASEGERREVGGGGGGGGVRGRLEKAESEDEGRAERTLSFTEERKRGKILVDSLNSTRFGGLQKRLSSTKKEQKLKHISSARDQKSKGRKLHRWAGDDPKLGYDWIAGLVESSSGVLDRSDEFFNDLDEFRKVNSAECSQPHQALPPDSDETAPPSPSHLPSSPSSTHTHCIESYRLNNRLFPIPHPLPPHPSHPHTLTPHCCPVCESRPKQRGEKEPQNYIRVSVPRSSLQVPYKMRSHRKRSFDPTDSMALSKHCLAGWNSLPPPSLPPQSSLDLKSALSAKASQHQMNFEPKPRPQMDFQTHLAKKAKLTSDPKPHPFSHSRSRCSQSRRQRSQQLLNSSRSLEYSLRSRSHPHT